MIEKLNRNRFHPYINDMLINKINEIIDTLNKIEESK